MSPPPKNANPAIPVARLRAYVHSLGQFKGLDAIAFDDFAASLQDVTRRELTDDFTAWKLSWTSGSFPYAKLARSIHAEVHRRQYRAIAIEPRPPAIPAANELLEGVRSYSDAAWAREAPLIEAAYAYAEERPAHFIASHGDAADGRTAFRHQVEEARKIVEEMLGNGIVVHEVGLGKTITGILVMLELVRRDPELTCLILVPSNLREQWAGEIASWSELKIANDDRTLHEDPYVLLAVDSAKEERRAAVLQSRRWGLLLVDEGHWFRNDDTERYRFAYALRARFRLLLTATPVHNSGYDIFHQVNMVRPGHLGRKAAFADNYMRGERQIINAPELQAKLAPVLSQRQRQETDHPFPTRAIVEVAIAASERSQDEVDLYNDVLSLLRGVYRWHYGGTTLLRRSSGKEQAVSRLVLIAMLILRELASHPVSAIKTLGGALRDTVEKLAERTRDTEDLRKLDLRLRDIVNRYENATWGLGQHRKTDRLIERLPELAQECGRVIVYVEFRETQKAIVDRLTHLPKPQLHEAGLASRPQIISYHGGLSQAEKARQIERLRKARQAWFISTDAGGQGLNLQDASVVVNFDFPWNPMRVEQRIGRVDRIGQKSDVVSVENYITHGTIEEYVYHTLREKLHVCEDVLGRVIPQMFQLRGMEGRYASPDDVLGIGEIILRSEDEADLRRRFREFGDDLGAEEARLSKLWAPRRRDRFRG